MITFYIYIYIWVDAFYSGAPPGHGVKVRVLWLKATKVLAHVQTAAHIETAACPGVSRLPEFLQTSRPGSVQTPGRDHPCHQRWHPKAYDPQAHPPSPYFNTSGGNGSTAAKKTPNNREMGLRASGVKIQMGGWGCLNAILVVPPKVYD